MLRGRISRSLFQRLCFLAAANAAVLVMIALLIKEGGSFREVLARAGPNIAPIILAGLGLTGIVFTGAIDLSIGSIIVVAGTVFGLLVHHQADPFLAFAACAATAWILSNVNAILVRTLNLPAIIITLAGLTFYRGLALVIADMGIPDFSGNISVQAEEYHRPGQEYAGWILAFALVCAGGLELFGASPRKWLALGNSAEACRLMGQNPHRILQSAFSVGGIFLGMAALVYATRVQSIEPARMALGFELQVIGAVILGGTHIFGGEGSYAGTLLGAFFLYFVSELLIYAGISPYFQDVIAGALIIGVIGFDCGLQRKRKLLEELA